MNTLWYFYYQCAYPHSKPQMPPLSQEILQDQQINLAQAVTKSFLFSWVLVHMRPCVCPLRVTFLFPPSLVEFLQSSPTGLQNQMLWELLLLTPDTQTGNPDMGLRTLIPMRNLCNIIIFKLGVAHLVCMGLIVSQMCPSYSLMASSLSFNLEYLSFLVVSNIFC